MTINLFEPLDKELRDILENLAGGLFPLDAWIKAKNYKPPEKDLPWRANGASLVPKDLGVIKFFEALIRETSADADLIERWQKIGAEPLKFSPLADVGAWRTHRGLDPNPEFGALESENILVDAEGKPISRASFYADYWPLLKEALKAAASQGAIDWVAFASSLFTDQPNFWPQNQPLKSSIFIKQFVKDMLYAMMGMRNEAPEPWKFALLIELGEHRRVGNAYTPANAEKAVKEYKKILKQLTQPPPSAAPVSEPSVSGPPVSEPPAGTPPVGSPPVNHKTEV